MHVNAHGMNLAHDRPWLVDVLNQADLVFCDGAGVVLGAASVWLIKRLKIKTIYGETIEFHPKKFNKGQIYGGLLFGFGWAMTGACPGPLFAQIGTGVSVVAVVILSAIAGTWVYGYFREKLPH